MNLIGLAVYREQKTLYLIGYVVHHVITNVILIGYAAEM